MADLPIRTRILNALRVNLEAISPHTASVYHHTMKAVYIAQADQIVEGFEMPVAVIVMEAGDQHEDKWSCGRTQHTLPLSIYGAIHPDPADPEASIEEIQRLASDINAAIELDLQLGGLALSVDVSSDEFQDATAEDIYWTRTGVHIRYRHKIGDPTAA